MDDLKDLWRKIIAESPMSEGATHGPRHWARVERNGLYLARETGANELVVRLFAVLHDCQRVNEAGDPGHGQRAAQYAAAIRHELPSLSGEAFEQLRFACEWHTDRRFSEDLTIGVCWDADRLDLGRIGITPNAEYLNSEAAREIARTRAFDALHQLPVRPV